MRRANGYGLFSRSRGCVTRRSKTFTGKSPTSIPTAILSTNGAPSFRSTAKGAAWVPFRQVASLEPLACAGADQPPLIVGEHDQDADE
jgi:hypothetical protein